MYGIFWFFILCFVIALGRIVYLQYIKPPEIVSDDIAYKFSEVEALRGDILATDGRAMATSIPYYELRMDFSVINRDTLEKYIDTLSSALSSVYTERTASQFKQLLLGERSKEKLNKYKKISTRLVDYVELEDIKKFPFINKGSRHSGLIVERKFKRIWPYNGLCKRVIGSINDENAGVGLEKSCDSLLKGIPGLQKMKRYLGGEWIPVNDERNCDPQDGLDVRTTINIDFQEAAQRALLEQLHAGDNKLEGATAIVMEVETGAIRAMVNLKRTSSGRYEEVYNYALAHASEPGSVFKAVTLTSLLEDNMVSLETHLDLGNGHWTYGKHTFSDTHAIGPCNVLKALEQSSNVAFAKMAVDYYAHDPWKFVKRIREMKVGVPYDLAIKGEAKSVIHDPGEKIWSVSSLPSMAIGYSLQVTPLQTLTFYNAIAANGKMSRPYLVEEYCHKGLVVKKFEPTVINPKICSEKTVKNMQKALRSVVENGTGRTIGNSIFPISGKTGTSRIANGRFGYSFDGYRKYQATFVGFFPSDAPRYSAIVVLYSDKTTGTFYGATWAGPVFKKMAEYLYSVAPQDWGIGQTEYRIGYPALSKARSSDQKVVLEKLKVNNGKQIPARVIDLGQLQDTIMADYCGMGLRNALYILENEGYKVTFSGSGRVIAQVPRAGERVEKGCSVYLELGKLSTDSTFINAMLDRISGTRITHIADSIINVNNASSAVVPNEP